MRAPVVALFLAAFVLACPGQQARQGGSAGSAGHGADRALAGATSLPESLRLPGEFEPAERLILVWDDYFADFLLDVVAAAWGEVAITIVIDTDRPSEELERSRLDPSWVHIVRMPVGSIWIRDFGPLVVHSSKGQRHIVHFDYTSAGDERDVPLRLGRELWGDWPQHKIALEFEGGNLQSDGSGRCITTAGYDEEDDAVAPVDMDALRRELRAKLGCEELFILPPLEGEPTGHVDMLATITGPGQILVGRYAGDVDPMNAERLDLAAEILESGGFTVRRIPMPAHSDGLFRSYTNAVAINQVVLVPVYPEDTSGEDEALAAFASAYPGRAIVPIVASDVIKLEGAIHCATMTVAADPAPGPVVARAR